MTSTRDDSLAEMDMTSTNNDSLVEVDSILGPALAGLRPACGERLLLGPGHCGSPVEWSCLGRVLGGVVQGVDSSQVVLNLLGSEGWRAPVRTDIWK